nr:hypothetical protein [Neobacillus sp. Marseille-Q6967]
MFDPTAFDNMKVVLEGALYDLDLSGKIVVTDRNDLMNMAKMSRSFDVSFKLNSPKKVTAKLQLESQLIHLAAELLPENIAKEQSGCLVKLKFFHEGISDESLLNDIQKLMLEIWGNTRNIQQSIVMYPFGSKVENRITVEFDRIVGEEQMDDLIEMIDFIMTTLDQLQMFHDGLE